ncbi:MAG: hypothetical protein M0Q92_13830 [Methanoregula sp.]|jgi:hypothetical protein|nr:hypothetical protein [Methanoregula sp.]
MAAIDPMKSMISSYLASPKGQEMIQGYLSSPEGQKAICDYIMTPPGNRTLRQILPVICDGLNLSPQTREAVMKNIAETE